MYKSKLIIIHFVISQFNELFIYYLSLWFSYIAYRYLWGLNHISTFIIRFCKRFRSFCLNCFIRVKITTCFGIIVLKFMFRLEFSVFIFTSEILNSIDKLYNLLFIIIIWLLTLIKLICLYLFTNFISKYNKIYLECVHM